MYSSGQQPPRPDTAPPPGAQPAYGYPSSGPGGPPLVPTMPNQYGAPVAAYGHAPYNPTASYTPQPSYAPPPQSFSSGNRMPSLKPKQSAFKLFDQTLSTVNRIGGHAVPGLSNALNDLRGKLSSSQSQPSPCAPSPYRPPQAYYGQQQQQQQQEQQPQQQQQQQQQQGSPLPPTLPPRPPPQPGYHAPSPIQPPTLPPRMSPQPSPPGFQGHPPQSQGVMMTPPIGTLSLQLQPQPTGADSFGPPPQPQHANSPSPGTPSTAQLQMQPPQPQQPPTSQYGPPQPQYITAQPTGVYGQPQQVQQHPPVTTAGYGPPQPQYATSPPPTITSQVFSQQPQQHQQPQQPQPTGWIPSQPTGYAPPQPQNTAFPSPGVPSPSFGVPSPGFGTPSPGFGAPSPGFGAPSPVLGSPGIGQYNSFAPQNPQYTNVISPTVAPPSIPFQNNAVSSASSNHQSSPPPPYAPFITPQPSGNVQKPITPETTGNPNQGQSPQPQPQPPPPSVVQVPGAVLGVAAAPTVFIAELDSTAPPKPSSPPSFVQELCGESAAPKPKTQPIPSGPQAGPPPGFPRNLPSLRLEGPGNSILAVCRQGRVDNVSTWYLANTAPGFTVCSRCYTDHVSCSRHTGLFDSFTGSASSDEGFVPGHLCNLSSHTVQAHIWPKVLKSHNTAPLASFMVRRGGVRNCRDNLDHRSNRWFAPVSSIEKPEFVVCEGCFLDNISAGSFASQFAALDESAPVPKDDHCMFRRSIYMSRAVSRYEKDDNWPLFRESVKKRLSLPRCTGQPVESGQWFTTKSPIPGFAMCESCYIDNIADSKFEADIIPLATEAGVSRACNMRSTNGVPVILAMDAAREFSNFSIFFGVASECIKLSPCGHPQSTYLSLAGPSSTEQPFTVCALHAQAYLAPFNITPHLVPFQSPEPQALGQPPPQAARCALSRTSKHTMAYLTSAQTSSDLGLLLPFQKEIARISKLPPCPSPA